MSGKSSLELPDDRAIRVLICDDSLVNLAVLRRVLENEGHIVSTARGGEEVLDEVARRPFDLVLLDIEMPGMSGIDVCRDLRARQLAKAYLPVILLTANTDKEARVRGLQAGATDFLTKPFDPTELVSRIHNHVAAKRLHDRVVAINRELEEEQSKVFRVQQSLLPSKLPRRPGLRFGARYEPFSMAGGDFYDVIERPGGTILLAMGDVSGHGIPSAMHMGTLRATLHSEADAGSDISTILQRLNRVLCFSLDPYSFVTFYLAELDPAALLLHHATAGHPPPLLHDPAAGGVAEVSLPRALPLGVDRDIVINTASLRLTAGQRLVIYTDGVTEQRSREGAFLDVEGLAGLVKRHAETHVEFLPTLLFRDIAAFHEGTEQSDDMTLLAVEIGEAGTPQP